MKDLDDVCICGPLHWTGCIQCILARREHDYYVPLLVEENRKEEKKEEKTHSRAAMQARAP